MGARRVRRAYEKFGFKHVLLRGFEFLLLQTQPTASLYWMTLPKWYQWRHSQELREYDDSLRAFELYYVDPKRVRHLTPRGRPSEGTLNDIGSVIGGEWDLQRCESDEHSLFYDNSIFDTLLYQAIEARYRCGRDWKETEFYHTVVDIVKEGKTEWHGCASIEDINRKCAYVDRLCDRIKKEGYKTQLELRDSRPSLDEPFGYMNAYLMEVAVDVTRDGELLLVDGRHRLYIAQMLDLDHIPVTIIVRHKKWMENVNERLDADESELLARDG